MTTIAPYFEKYAQLSFERVTDSVLLIRIGGEAMNAQLHSELAEVWLDVDRDPAVRAAIITGTGNSFCPGGDLEMEYRLLENYDLILETMRTARSLVLNMMNSNTPIISAINGSAAGGGLAVGLMAHISVIAEDARVSDGHTSIGVTAGDHSAMLWPLLCGLAKARHLLLTSKAIDGKEAERIGLVSQCVPRESILDAALEIAKSIARKPQPAIESTLRSLNHWARAAQPAFEASLALEMLDFFGPGARAGLDALVARHDWQPPDVEP